VSPNNNPALERPARKGRHSLGHWEISGNSNTNGHDNALFHKEAIALVMDEMPTWDSWRNVLHIADEVVCDTIYGVDEIRDVAGVWLKAL